jgi:hypothetical protein
MTIKGIYKLAYTLNKEQKDLIVTVELRMIEGFNQPGRNVWEGHVVVNDRQYAEDLSYCVDAELACERIGLKLKAELIEAAEKAKQKFRLRKETVNGKKLEVIVT